MSDIHVFIDESGDLGFQFDKPYRNGGSSRYLTISFLLTPPDLLPLTKRIVKKLYQKRKQPSSIELKGANLTYSEQQYFALKVVDLLKMNNQIKIFVITVNKRRVEAHIRSDPNKLYNYAVGLALLQRIKSEKRVVFTPDKRSIKVQSGNSLVDYLQTELWFKLNSKTTIINNPQESHKYLNLQFIDFITHIIWDHFENRRKTVYNILLPKIGLKLLFFP